ncbi:hypothetical protein DWU98_05920 [Dyella monticola]|uniref:Lipoprotein n=1 Tax=Dyella monticola TaxID=1927958 RepID=A0A370X683_9GAMM|nr:hypothetical protein [Dyella monticola]RDS83842.1 hypothetical protein DWU98_05920 [Dyella monticola]
MKKYARLFPALTLIFAGCKSTPPVNGRVVPEAKLTTGQLIQSGPNRMANLELRDNLDALYVLMDKLYKRNPAEWKKGSSHSRQDAAANVRTALEQHKPLPGLDARDTAAMRLALDPEFKGDRVATLVYGLGDMLITAHGGKRQQYLIDGLDAQKVYNAARNIEITMWMLAQRRDRAGQPLLLSNADSEHERNLSFERLFGAMIGRLDLVAEFTSEKYRRSVIDYAQSFFGGQFLQFLPVSEVSAAASSL